MFLACTVKCSIKAIKVSYRLISFRKDRKKLLSVLLQSIVILYISYCTFHCTQGITQF